MKTVLHKADTRGRSLYDWLDSRHTFSFDRYYDPRRMSFGALRVLNDDRVAPGEGFGRHPHKNMEIISIPLKGVLQHGDSINNNRTVQPGDIQTMSAGTGIFHSEMNGSQTEPVEFLQIWVMPNRENKQPAYQDYDIRPFLKKNELATIVAPDGTAPAKMQQDTWFSLGEVEAGRDIEYRMHLPAMGVYLFLIEGEVEVDGTVLTRRDGLG
ncbi:MAG: pirin family protein, partial [Prevotellaceae bacterium]|nr:pirin family protein [Prevotellaceae bacterium]